jgi:putative ABC transport system permease protein
METLVHDLRYALRVARKTPGLAVPAILTLALGMGAATMMFSVLNAVLLRPLPYPHSDRLIQIWETDPHFGGRRIPVSPYDFLEWAKSVQSLSYIATYDYDTVILGSLKQPQRINAQFVSAGFFEVFQISPVKGRTFLLGEDQSGHDALAVLSYGAWSRYFNRAPDIVGKPITLDNQTYTVIGIMPADFGFPNDEVDVWRIPGFDARRARRGNHFLASVGRMKPGINLEQAQAEMNKITGDLNREDGRSVAVRLLGLQEAIVGNMRGRILLLWASVLALLLIACANVAGLLLARTAARQKEVAMRVALGGTRGRLIQQFLTESVLLAIFAGILGLAISYVAGHFLIARTHGTVPRLRDLQIDGWALGFTCLACIITGLIFGIAPAIHALRFDLHTALKESGAVAQLSARLRLHSVFVVAEIALAMVLLVSDGLLIKSLWRLEQVDPGFQSQNVLSFRFSVPNGKYNSLQRSDLYQRVLDRLAAIPGIESVGATSDLPFGGSRSGENFEIEGHPAKPGETLQSDYRTVSSDYTHTMRIRLLAGREFSASDTRDAPYVLIVNQAFVKKFLSGVEPLGQRLKIKNHLYQIVGVISDVKHLNLAAPSDSEMYVPYSQADPSNWTFFVVRSRIDATTLPATLRSAVQEVAPDEPIYGLSAITALVESSFSPQKISSILLAVFAALALLLAAIGIYGLVAYSVTQRTHEIGIRMALGADRSNVLRLMLSQGALIGLAGLALGTLIAYLGTRVLSSMLFDVHPRDPSIFIAVAVCLITVVFLATYIPARRATNTNPLVALRFE